MPWLRDKLEGKYGKKLWIDAIGWVWELSSIALMVYFTWTIRIWMLECQCPQLCQGNECFQLQKECVIPLEHRNDVPWNGDDIGGGYKEKEGWWITKAEGTIPGQGISP